MTPGTVVTWMTGPGMGRPAGGVCSGVVREVVGALCFVATATPVPCVLGRGTDMEWHTSTDRVWLPVAGPWVSVAAPAPWIPPYLRR